jgi:hypothetical protein
MTVNTVSSSRTEIHFIMPHFDIEEISVQGQKFHLLNISDGIPSADTGFPSIPHYVATVAVPIGAKVSIAEINFSEPHYRDNLNIFPVQNLQNPNHSLDYNTEFYHSSDKNLIYPKQTHLLTDIQSMRDYQFVILQVNPFRYIPAEKKLQITNEIKITLSHPHESSTPVYNLNRNISAAFEPMYEALISNFDQIRLPDPIYQEPAILIITANGGPNATVLNNIMNWKREKGFRVQHVDFPTVASTIAIKNEILTAYNTWGPEWVILLGHSGAGSFSIPLHNYYVPTSPPYNAPNDFWYTQLVGSNLFGDINIGRISVSTSAHLQNYWQKIVRYEQNPLTGIDTSFYNRTFLVGDNRESGISTWIINRYIKSLIAGHDPTHSFTELYQWGVTGTTQVSTVNNNPVINYNYRGLQFMGPTPLNPTGFTNTNRLFNAVWITCATSMVGQNLTEDVTRHMFSSLPAGAMTAIGMTTTRTHTAFNNALNGGVYYSMYPSNMHTMGQATIMGAAFCMIAYPGNTEAAGLAHNLILYGDPSAHIWRAFPRTFTNILPTTISVGTQAIRFAVTESTGNVVPNAWVTISQSSSSYLSKGLTDANGVTYVPLDPELTGSVTITVSKPDFAPLRATISIIDTNPMVSVSNYLIYDPLPTGNDNSSINPGETIHLTLLVKNHRLHPVNNLSATLSSESDLVDILEHTVELTPNSIGAGMEQNFVDAFTFTVSQFTPDKSLLPLTIAITDGSETWVSHILPEIKGVDIEVLNITTASTQSFVPINIATNIFFQLKNSGSYESYPLQAQLVSRSRYLDILSEPNLISIPNIVPGASLTTSVPFSVFVYEFVIPGMRLEAELHLWNGESYEAIVPITILTGPKLVTDPTGPCDYGYIILDSFDVGYDDAPVYDWIEIKHLPNANTGMIDNNINVEEASVIRNLPFTARYYGEDYTQITICSNGFFTFGITEQRDFRNLPIPGPIVPRNMVAPYWTDLAFPIPVGSNTGQVFAAFVPEDGAYVITWDRVRYVVSNATATGLVVGDSVSFQAIIYDPNINPTPRGDSPIKFQYRRFFPGIQQSATNHPFQYITVGFQDHTNLRGLEYCFNNVYSPGSRPLAHGMALLITQPNTILDQPLLAISQPFYHPRNGSNAIMAGDILDIGLLVTNTGFSVAENVNASISFVSPYIEVLNATTSISDIEPFSSQSNIEYLSIFISPDIPNQTQITATVNITAEPNLSWNRLLFFTVSRPHITYRSHLLNDSSGNGDGVIDPGEDIKLIVNVENSTNFDIFNAFATLTGSSEFLTINTENINLPIMKGNTIHQLVFDISIALDIADVFTTFPVTLSISATNAPNFSRTISLGVNQSPILLHETFDTWLPPGGWSINGLATPWGISQTNHAGGVAPELRFFGATGNGITRLVSPIINTTDLTQINISFKHSGTFSNVSGRTQIGIATRNNYGLWNTPGAVVWSWDVTNNTIEPTSINIPVSNSSVGHSTFQICFYVSGVFADVVNWFVDDLSIQVTYGNSAMLSGLVSMDFWGNEKLNLVVSAGNISTSINPDKTYNLFLQPGLYPIVSVFDPFIVSNTHTDINLVAGQHMSNINFNLLYRSAPWDLIVYDIDDQNEYEVTLSFQHHYDRATNPLNFTHYNVFRQVNSTAFSLFKTINREIAWADTITQFLDVLDPTNRYRYYVTASYPTGNSRISNILYIDPNDIEVGEHIYDEPDVSEYDRTCTPNVLKLAQNFPNPFNPSTNISFTIPDDSIVSIKIFNIKGQLVRDLKNDFMKSGTHVVQWHGENDTGRSVASGVYFIRVNDGVNTAIRKAILMK